jgi:hypothetical protein
MKGSLETLENRIKTIDIIQEEIFQKNSRVQSSEPQK